MASPDQRPPTRVVEEPGRSPLPYFAVAIVAAVALWTYLQPSFDLPTRSERAASGNKATPAAEPPTVSQSGPGSISRPIRSPENGAMGDIRTIFSADDYPAIAQQLNEQGTVVARLTVAPSGKVSACEVTRSSGYISLDQATCNIIQRRARFIPARDASGATVEDWVTTPPIVWRLEG